jgi:D-alanyl-D-alanine carboxypeptidase (penicillin-binding protein 5/6)
MRVVTLPNQKVVKKRRRHFAAWFFAVFLFAAPTVTYFRPLPPATVTVATKKELPGSSPSISWPSGHVAFSAEGYDFLAGSETNVKVSTASIAKVITVLCVLEKKPLNVGETGPTITMTAEDVQRYETEVARDGTAFAVAAGDTLTEYEMLEAILLPSANNIADTAAIWAFGSLDAYRTYAQAFVEEHGMTATVVGPDASGYDPSTTSTPSDLIKLAKLALKNPVVMNITGKSSAIIGDGVEIYNHNVLTGKNGVTGLKTGRNDENSGGLLFTANVGSGTDVVHVAGIVIDAGSLSAALSGTANLLTSLQDEFPMTIVAAKGVSVGTLRTAWGSETPVVAKNTLQIQHWSGSTVYTYSSLTPASGTQRETVGTLYAQGDGRKSSAILEVAQPAAGPSLWWRITHFR